MTKLRLCVLLLAFAPVACDDETSDPTPDADVATGDADAGGEDAEPDIVPETGDDADAAPDVGDAGDGGEGPSFPIDELGPITDLRIDGLDGEVEIKLDDHGIPSIRCETNEDCVAALGYLHARDRFIQMDIRRRLVRGELSAIVAAGDPVLDVDAASRTLYATPEGEPITEYVLEHVSEDSMALLEAYSRGVNAWIDDLESGENGASLQAEYGFALIQMSEIRPWEPEDCIASVAALIESLTNDGDADLSYGAMFNAIEEDPEYDETVFEDYFRPRPFSGAVVIDDYEYTPEAAKAARAAIDAAQLARFGPVMHEAAQNLARIRAVLGAVEDRGSNNWVVGPGLTAGGNPLLSNDPHLGFSNPSVWYAAHMDAVTEGDGDYHVAGLSFAGLPFIILGQNEDIAWGATNTTLDLSDVYLEELTEDGDGVLFDGGEVDFVEVEHTFTQAGGAEVTRTSLYVPHHGPVLSIDREEGTAVTLRWTGNRMSTDINVLTELMRASTVEEGREALRNVTTIGQNWVLIDTAGHFGWFPYNTVPIRPWASADQLAYLPLDGGGDFEWDGFIEYDDLPQAYDREEGYLATANGDWTGALQDGDPTNDGHPLLQTYVASGFRQERIIDLIEATDEHTIETMRDIVGDTYSIVGELTVPVLLEAERESLAAGEQALYDAIEAWDFTCPTGLATSDPAGDASADADELAAARGCAAFHRVLGDFFRLWMGDERQASEWPRGPSIDSFLRVLLRPEELTQPDLFWDDVTTDDATETQADILALAYEAAAARLDELLGDDPADWLWGRLHAATLRADLFSSFGIADYDEGRFAKDGGFLTVNVSNPSLGAPAMDVFGGASMRLLCEAPATGVTCSVQLAGGQPHFREEPNYLGMLENWLANEPHELSLDFEALDADVITATVPDN